GTVSWDGTARLWDATTGSPLAPSFISPFTETGPFALSSDCRTLLAGGSEKPAHLWNVATGTLVGTPLETKSQILCAAFSPDGRMVLTSLEGGIACFWEVVSGKRIGPMLPHNDGVVVAAFSPDGRTVFTGCRNGTGHLWDATTGKAIGATLQHPRTIA